MLACTSLVFFFQEMIPVLKHSFGGHSAQEEEGHREEIPFIEKTARTLAIDPPQLALVDDADPILFSTTGKTPSIYLSSSLLASLSEDQLQAALAHEMAHIARNRRPLLMLAFALRILLFHNPVVLVKFRRAVRDEEKICDDIAVSLTGNRNALASALEKFYSEQVGPAQTDRNLAAFTSSLQEQSHNEHLKSRIERLIHERPQRSGKDIFPLGTAAAVIVLVNYFIV